MGNVYKISLSDEEQAELEERVKGSDYFTVQDYIMGTLFGKEPLIQAEDVYFAVAKFHVLPVGRLFTIDELLPSSLTISLKGREQRYKGVVCKAIKEGLSSLDNVNFEEVSEGRKRVYRKML